MTATCKKTSQHIGCKVSWQFVAAPRTVQDCRKKNKSTCIILQRHAAFSETCGRCPWCRHPRRSMVYLKQYAGAEQRCATTAAASGFLGLSLITERSLIWLLMKK